MCHEEPLYIFQKQYLHQELLTKAKAQTLDFETRVAKEKSRGEGGMDASQIKACAEGA